MDTKVINRICSGLSPGAAKAAPGAACYVLRGSLLHPLSRGGKVSSSLGTRTPWWYYFVSWLG